MAFMMPPRGFARQNRRRDNNFLALFLFSQLLRQIDRLPVKPPVTLATMAVLSVLYFSPESLGIHNNPYDWAFNPSLILHEEQWDRMWLSPLVHASVTHLYYNLSSFLYKGVTLETTFGSQTFGVLLAVLTVTSQVVFLLSSYIATVLGLAPTAMITSTVGFSGVIFALKVVLNALDDNEVDFGMRRLFAFNIPWSEIVWVELIVAQLMVPNASFLGHLSGIVAGVLVTPLIPLLSTGFRIIPWRRAPRFWGRGLATNNVRTTTRNSNSANAERVEARMPIQQRPHESGGADSPTTFHLSSEELRRRRLERFQ